MMFVRRIVARQGGLPVRLVELSRCWIGRGAGTSWLGPDSHGERQGFGGCLFDFWRRCDALGAVAARVF